MKIIRIFLLIGSRPLEGSALDSELALLDFFPNQINAGRDGLAGADSGANRADAIVKALGLHRM